MKVLFLLACFALIGCGGMPSPIQHPSGSFTVDFHEEQAGQVLVTSSASVPVEVHISLGESQEEATPELSFVGPLDITVQPGQTFTGPNSGFRFAAVVTDPAHVQDLQFGVKSSAVDFPVIAQFQSSDQELMGIWQASVRTIRLSMQQDQQQVIVDAPKRDHLVWSGDMYVEARVARAVFGHAADPMIKSSLVKLATSTPNCPNCGCHDINCCATYSAWWVLTVADQLDFDHDTAFVQSIPLLRVLQTMAGELNGSLFDSSKSDFGNVWVDWSPGMGTGVGLSMHRNTLARTLAGLRIDARQTLPDSSRRKPSSVGVQSCERRVPETA